MINKYVKVILKDKTQILGKSLKIDKSKNLMIIQDIDALIEVKPSPNVGRDSIKETIGTRKEVTYIPTEHILYWQKFEDYQNEA